jgi:hypothetical protein
VTVAAAAPAVTGPAGGLRRLLRRRLAPAAGLALLLAGGALAVRVTAMTLLREDSGLMWLSTSAACVLAGVALVLLAIDPFAPARAGADEPDPAVPRG